MTEDELEQYCIQKLRDLGYTHLHGPDIAPDTVTAERASYRDVILPAVLRRAVERLNPDVPSAALDQALREVARISAPDVITANQTFHVLFTDGVDVEYQRDGVTRGVKVWLADFANPANNDFCVINQFTIIENEHTRRPDLILFVNGLPLVVIELKNPADENADVRKAYAQLQTYKDQIPALFTYNGLLVISDGLDARAGSLTADYARFSAWKLPPSDLPSPPRRGVGGEVQIATLIDHLLDPATLLDLIRHFTVFERTASEDPVTKLTTVQVAKKTAAYHQYYAVNKAVASTRRAAAPEGDRKGGVFWHTQGSGKSLSMVFFAGKIVLALDNPTLVVITDRNDLDDQLFDTFAASTQLLRQPPVQAESRDHLVQLLNVASGGIVFTTIQKFFPPDKAAVYPRLSGRRNIVVIADEAHRSQYGFLPREVDEKDAAGEIVGKRTAYGFAKYLRDALPNAAFIGFTGTPIESTDVNTPAVFGDYVDIYDIAQAVNDGATVPIYYESRLAKIELPAEGRKLLEALDKDLEKEDLTAAQEARAKWTRLEAIVGHPARLKKVAADIVSHFETRQQVFNGKAMIVAMSRAIAVALYKEIVDLRPDWRDDALDRGRIKVIMTAAASDGPDMARHHTHKEQRRRLAARFKDPADPLHLVIVVDMWLTGFDAPCLHTLYVDKPMRGHGLMQAIARVNRVYGDKPGGHVVDYLGIAADLRDALTFYVQSGGKGNPAETQEQAVTILLTKLEIARQMFAGFDYWPYFSAAIFAKLTLILDAQEHILGLKKGDGPTGRERFTQVVSDLSKALALAVPHPQAMEVKEEIAFFQAVRARLRKFEPGAGGKSDAEIEIAVRQVIDQALVAGEVINVLDAAGLKTGSAILSDEFLAQVRQMTRKNVALELLKKLLSDALRSLRKTNLIQSRRLAEMLEETLRRYQNQGLSAQQVIDELIKMAQDITAADARGESLGLSAYELAFYDALAANQSAQDVLGVDKLRELAVVLVDKVRKNASIDWAIKESTRAKMRVIVKRLLNKYGYPPDMQKLATENVIQQAELLAEFEIEGVER